MATKSEIRAEAARLLSRFQQAGALPVETDILQPADTLLDLYGEDIRARAFVTQDPLSGEKMLRPDFTVPVAQMHMTGGAEPARYTYAGEVFRKQETEAARATEYFQVGYEVFDRSSPENIDAEVFALFWQALAPLQLRASIGDIGILIAAVNGLTTTQRRKAALMRHIWRPARFRALIERFSGRQQMPESRVRLLANDDPFSGHEKLVGLRSKGEIQERIDALAKDMSAPPLLPDEVASLEQILAIRDQAPAALDQLKSVAAKFVAIAPAVAVLDARLAAFGNRGLDVDALTFEASYGRTSMEYYDGFVFGFYAGGLPELPPIATGGRYDALTQVLGHGRSVPAVGGVIRPALVLALQERGS